MIILNLTTLSEAPVPAGGSMLAMFLPLILVFVLMYFVTIRPQKKRDEELRKQINAMQVGDEVITIGGITGRIFNIQDDEVTISTSVQNTLMTFKKSAIAHVINKTAVQESASSDSTTEEKPKKQGLFSRIRGNKGDEQDE